MLICDVTDILECVRTATNRGFHQELDIPVAVERHLSTGSSTSSSPLYRRAVRVSMGEVFAVPYARCGPWSDGLRTLADAGFTLLALTPAPDAEPVDAVSLRPEEKAGVPLGSEGPGLTAEALAAATRRRRSPPRPGGCASRWLPASTR